ncbi:ubiquitin carboxyl-terminal hydrolase 35 [Anoplophora glabripennis]|uniref:Ubiquitin carboxyl-terminal hydrolase n=1 Tax=Anoplophora glabripennis TaxID=217634 RepID=V5I980_ANOGL|nr:ubiquitin carboxyl-terminal hydrolase 35 [Anoplophora glabripennis]
MAVKQKVVECVDPSNEARLQIILRALQGISSAQDELHDKVWAHVVISLGTVPVPTDETSYMKFIEDIKSVQNILAKECSSQKQVFAALKALYDEISNPNKHLSPVMSIVLKLIDEDDIPNAVKYILNTGYPEQSLERALRTLCNWLTKWLWTDNLGPLVLAFMKGLEAEHHYDILMDVTLANVDTLFKLLILPKSRKSVGPVVLYMLSRVQHSPQIFHKIIPLVNVVCKQLDTQKTETSLLYLQAIVNLCIALMEHFPGFPNIYEPLTQTLQPYCPDSNYKQTLHCKSWSDGTNAIIPSRYSVGKVGLNNLGNTCYMNSVLQALFMTKKFRNDVLLHHKEMMPLFSKLQVLFALLQFSKKFSLSPTDILNLSRPPGFLLGHQHDSSEFLGYLLDTLHEQEKNVSTASSSSEGAVAVTDVQTVVQQSFGGRTITVSRCDVCSTKSERADNFRELQLSFPNNSDNQSVQKLLQYYLQPEKLHGDNQYHCDICTTLTDGERITRIVEAPPRLILTLKHFRYDPASQQRTKLLQRVELDERFALGDYEYELYAVVVHCGSSVDSGHYYTFAKDKSDWYKFNDGSVMKARSDDPSRLKPPETPYILFYGRQDNAEPENLPCAVLSNRLQSTLKKDESEYDSEKRKQSLKMYNRQNRNDEPPPPGCGGGGFSSTAGNMFVC